MKVVKRRKLKPLFKHQLIITVVSVFIVVATALSGSFAIFSKTDHGTEYNIVQVGQLELSYVDLNEEGNVLQLASDYPITDATGISSNPYRFSVENTGTLVANYKIKIIDDVDTITADGCNDNLLNTAYLRYKFDHGEVGTLKDLENDNGYIIASGTLQPFESNIHEVRLWINENSPNSVLGNHYHGKIIIEMEQGTGSSSSSRPVNPIAPVSEKAFASDNLGESCKTYNDGTDTFLVGQCSKNYVWYSGKLWRVVLKNNETGAVKLVTDNAITVIPYNIHDNSTFTNSYADQWLSQEFLPTLHDYQNYLVVDSLWDVTTDSSNTPARPNQTTTLNRTVGLLNAYEYYTTYNNSDGLANSATGYLNNNTFWWLMTPYDATKVRDVRVYGDLLNYNPYVGYGLRPSINFLSNVQTSIGNGTISNPYRIVGDEQEIINGNTLISTRYSGEYVKFNNELYRIVGIENQLTKITAVDNPSQLQDNQFHNNGTVAISFADASIKIDLNNYYTNNIVDSYKEMIESNATWYLGIVGEGTNYKASICKTASASISSISCEKTSTTSVANIGLPRIGEMFTSQITRGTKTRFWTLTPFTTLTTRYMNTDGSLSGATTTYEYGARPSMYLKANVRIASTNTGDGTYEKPYDLELGE